VTSRDKLASFNSPSNEQEFDQIKEKLFALMQEVANDDNILPETGLIAVVSMDLARAASDYAHALINGQSEDIAEKRALLKSFMGWLTEVE
jgi:hypothetical protein